MVEYSHRYALLFPRSTMSICFPYIASAGGMQILLKNHNIATIIAINLNNTHTRANGVICNPNASR